MGVGGGEEGRPGWDLPRVRCVAGVCGQPADGLRWARPSVHAVRFQVQSRVHTHRGITACSAECAWLIGPHFVQGEGRPRGPKGLTVQRTSALGCTRDAVGFLGFPVAGGQSPETCALCPGPGLAGAAGGR